MSADMQASLDPDEVARELFAAAERRAESHKRRLGSGSGSDIARFAREAGPRVASKPETLAEARAAFERLVDEMVVASREIDGYALDHSEIIGEQTLARALSRLCPLFPIC